MITDMTADEHGQKNHKSPLTIVVKVKDEVGKLWEFLEIIGVSFVMAK